MIHLNLPPSVVEMHDEARCHYRCEYTEPGRGPKPYVYITETDGEVEVFLNGERYNDRMPIGPDFVLRLGAYLMTRDPEVGDGSVYDISGYDRFLDTMATAEGVASFLGMIGFETTLIQGETVREFLPPRLPEDDPT